MPEMAYEHPIHVMTSEPCEAGRAQALSPSFCDRNSKADLPKVMRQLQTTPVFTLPPVWATVNLCSKRGDRNRVTKVEVEFRRGYLNRKS